MTRSKGVIYAWRAAATIFLAAFCCGGSALAQEEEPFNAAAYAAYATAWMQIHRALPLEPIDASSALSYWQKADGFLSFALERDPNEPMIGRPLLACALRLGMTEKAVDLLKRFPVGAISPDVNAGFGLIHKLPNSDDVVKSYIIAVSDKQLPAEKRLLLLREGGDYALLKRHFIEALSFYNDAVNAAPGDAELVERVMRLYTVLNKLDRALTVGQRFVESRKSFTDAKASGIVDQLALLYGQTGRAAEGAKVFARLYRLEPNRAPICESYMVLLQSAGQWPEASRVAKEFLRRHKNLRTRVVYAGLLAAEGKSEEAAEILAAILKKSPAPKNVPAFLVGTVMSVSNALAREGKTERAAQLLGQALELPEPVLPPRLRDGMRVDLAQMYMAAKKPVKARQVLNDILDSRPDMIEAWAALADIDWNSGNRRAALATSRRGLRINPKGPVALRLRAQLAHFLDQCGKTDQAITRLRENLAEDATDAESCNNLGYLYTERGTNWDEALSLIMTAVKAEPQNAAYLDSLGWVKYKIALRDNDLDTLKASAAALSHALKRDPGDAVTHDHAADVLYTLGHWEGALKSWQAAIQLAGGNTERLPNLETVKKKLAAVQKQLAKEMTTTQPRPTVRPLKPPPEGP